MRNKHECTLQQTEVPIINQVVETGMFIRERRKYYKMCMISIKHPFTFVYFKSAKARRREEVRHLINYLNMIHPFSMLNLYWEFFFVLVYAYMFVVLSVGAAYQVDKELFHISFSKFIVDLILLIDMIKIFFTGYYDGERNQVILKSSSVAKQYFKTYFVIDFLSILHSMFLPLYWQNDKSKILLAILPVLRIFVALRIFRLKRWLDALELFRLYMNVSSYLNRALKTVLTTCVILLSLYSVLFQLDNAINVYILKHYRRNINKYRSYYSTTLSLFVVTHGDKRFDHVLKIILSVISLGIGYCLQMFLFAQIYQVWKIFVNARNKNESLFQQFKEYMKYKGLPVSVRQKFLAFFNFKFQNQFYNEPLINRMLSKILKQEILVYVTRNHIEKVEFFKELPEVVLSKLLSHLKSEIFLQNDVIITAGVPGKCMYFIYFGTVAIYSPSGKEVCHLEDGAHFGEIALIFNEPRVATVVAVTPCELFILNRSDYLKALEPYPEIKAKIIEIAQERMKNSKSI